MINNDSLIAGYLTGSIQGNMTAVETMRACNTSEKEIVDFLMERMKFILDNVKNGIK
jgi:hypothetical protein